MRVYRGDDYARTDSKQPSDCVTEWKKSGRIALNGTKNKSSGRRTRLWLEIDERDVLELAIAMLERHREKEETDRSFEQLIRALREYEGVAEG